MRSWNRLLITLAVIGASTTFVQGQTTEESAQHQVLVPEDPVTHPVPATNTSNDVSHDDVPAGLMQMLPASQFYSPYAFVVDKKARILNVWQQTAMGLKKVASFPADLGRSMGDKRNTGDHKTPEGIYFLQTRLEGATLDFKLYGKRAFTTDYPNFFDRIEGKTGHGIWLHAVPDEVPLTRGSRGCVVVRNNAILDLTQYVNLGRTPLLIQNQTELTSSKDLSKQTTDIMQWIESWRSAWERKDIDRYITHYGPEFHSMNMNREQWRAYKARLSEYYKSIAVRISRPMIFGDRDRAIVRFLQEYTSDQHSDFGEKVLFLKRTGVNYRIIGETWTSENSRIARDEIEASLKTTGASGRCTDSAADCIRTNALIQ